MTGEGAGAAPDRPRRRDALDHPDKGDGTPAGQNDGVVEYNSAHIDGVESELVVVRQEHSCQSNPHTIAEVRRMLLEHLMTP